MLGGSIPEERIFLPPVQSSQSLINNLNSSQASYPPLLLKLVLYLLLTAQHTLVRTEADCFNSSYARTSRASSMTCELSETNILDEVHGRLRKRRRRHCKLHFIYLCCLHIFKKTCKKIPAKYSFFCNSVKNSAKGFVAYLLIAFWQTSQSTYPNIKKKPALLF